jgi:rubredoxin
MSRKINYPLPKPTWTCPHCGFIHRPADLLRIDDEQLRCKQCGQAFDAAPDKPTANQPGAQPDLRPRAAVVNARGDSSASYAF